MIRRTDQQSERHNSGNHSIRAAKRRKKVNKDSLRDLQNNIKHTNTHIIGIPEVGKRKKGVENSFEERVLENFPNLEKKTDIQVQEHRES